MNSVSPLRTVALTHRLIVRQLLTRGRVHTLHLRASRPAGRLTVQLDGRRLEQTTSLLPPTEDTDVLELRSWEPVRVLSLDLEAGR